MNYDAYKNKLDYPSRDAKDFKERAQAYNLETARLEAQFKQDFFVELDIVGHPKADKLYSKAWEHGHSAGYQEVMNYGYDLVDLIKD